MKGLRFAGTAEEIACCKRILALYPWQRYQYRLGTYTRVPRKSTTLFRRQRMRWTEYGPTPMQLLEQGRPLVEFEPRWLKPVMGSGPMLFAGDIHIGGACWDQCSNKMPVVFCHPQSMDRATALAEAGRMTPGGTHSEVVRAAIEREKISDHLLWYTEVRRQRPALSAEPRATDAMIRRNRRGIVLKSDRWIESG
ncbi:hypothetical protein [Tomitella biformata]|uniref:hypothetical protein n=1 Tax=Tomitella biformata TaxID=630403 RepID=UPI0004671A78|nr:hypothetical protein [Tomitella biformata]